MPEKHFEEYGRDNPIGAMLRLTSRLIECGLTALLASKDQSGVIQIMWPLQLPDKRL